MDEEDRVFEKLCRSPLKDVMSELFEKQLLVYDYQTQRISVVLCSELESICKKHGWKIEDITDTTNE